MALNAPVLIRAHFDGKTIVPDEPVDLPVDEPLIVEVKPKWKEVKKPDPVEAQAAWERIVERAQSRPGANIPDEALRRENMYEDRL